MALVERPQCRPLSGHGFGALIAINGRRPGHAAPTPPAASPRQDSSAQPLVLALVSLMAWAGARAKSAPRSPYPCAAWQQCSRGVRRPATPPLKSG
jgi:hypothetical protein